jgi:hypothetical protein
MAMTRRELEHTLAQYRAGLGAELALLHQLAALSLAGRRADHLPAAERSALSDDRDRVIANIASIERDLAPVREALATSPAGLDGGTAALDAVGHQHRQARDLLEQIADADGHTIELLKNATREPLVNTGDGNEGRGSLAAYRRVIAPPLEGARIVDRRG